MKSDAVRAEAKFGPVSFDGAYSISQRTIFGRDAGPRTAFDGNFVFLGAGSKLGPVAVKAFGYPVLPALYIAATASILIVLLVDPQQRLYSGLGLLLVLLGVPVYWLWRRGQARAAS